MAITTFKNLITPVGGFKRKPDSVYVDEKAVSEATAARPEVLIAETSVTDAGVTQIAYPTIFADAREQYGEHVRFRVYVSSPRNLFVYTSTSGEGLYLGMYTGGSTLPGGTVDRTTFTDQTNHIGSAAQATFYLATTLADVSPGSTSDRASIEINIGFDLVAEASRVVYDGFSGTSDDNVFGFGTARAVADGFYLKGGSNYEFNTGVEVAVYAIK